MISRIQGLAILALLATLPATALAGFEYELTQTFEAKRSPLTAEQDADATIARVARSKKIALREAASFREMYLSLEKVSRLTATARGSLRVSAGNWGSDVVFPVINLSTASTSPSVERYDGKATAKYLGSQEMWEIQPHDRRGLGGLFLDRYLQTGYLDPLTHRVETTRLPDGRLQDRYDRVLPLDDPSTHMDERFYLVWSDERRTRLLSAWNETSVARHVDFWAKRATYQIVRPSPARSGRLFDEATAQRGLGDRRVSERYRFVRRIPDPSLPYRLLHDVKAGTLVTETNGSPEVTLTYSYAGTRIDPSQAALEKKQAVGLGLGAFGTLSVLFLGLLAYQSRRPLVPDEPRSSE